MAVNMPGVSCRFGGEVAMRYGDFVVVDFEFNVASPGVRTHLNKLLKLFGCMLIESQPKRLHGDPFQVPI